MTSFWRQKPASYFPAKPLTGCPRISRPFCTVINSNISRHLAGRGRETPTFWRETSFWRQNSRHHLSTSSPLDPIFNGEPISGLKMPVSRRPCKLGTTDKNTRLKCPQMGLPMTHGARPCCDKFGALTCDFFLTFQKKSNDLPCMMRCGI